MKVRFCVCARFLRNLGGTCASLSCDGKEFGRTEVIKGTNSPMWKKVFLLECDNIEETSVVVAVLSNGEQEEVGRKEFNVAEILGRRSKVVSEKLDGGGNIYVHAAENVTSDSSFKFQICGKGLVNVSRARKLAKKSDPFYELQSTSGGIVYTSEVKDRNLNPDWSQAQVDLVSLCNGDFSAPIKFTIFDKDRGEKRKRMGSFDTSVNGLVVAAATGESIAMTEDGDNTGQIRVLQADFIGFVSPWQVLKVGASAIDLEEATSVVAQAKSQVAEKLEGESEEARLDAEARRKSEQKAAHALREAQVAAAEAEAASVDAANEAEKIRKAGLLGTLKFQFVGKKLKDVHFGFINKSDPFFVLQKAASESDGKVDWSHVFISAVVHDDLNPTWQESEVEVSDICSGNLDKKVRVIVFDWEKSGKHQLLGFFETSVNGIISAQRSAEEFLLVDDKNNETGRIIVQNAELVNFVDPEKVEEKAKALADKADEARYFAIGREGRAKLKSRIAKEADDVAGQKEEEAEAVTKEAKAALKLT